MSGKEFSSTFVIVGGGIAGVSCAEHLSTWCSEETITLITATDLVKTACNLKQFGRTLQEFDVEEKPFTFLSERSANVIVVRSVVTAFDPQAHYLITTSGLKFHYKKLCICTGGKPNIIASSPHVIGIRDTESVHQFQKKLSKARRVVIIGNGGIALELAFEMHGCEVVWAIKDQAIGNTFFDKGAAAFFLPQVEATGSCSDSKQKKFMDPTVRIMKCGTAETELIKGSQESSSSDSTQVLCGGALGPDWSSGLPLNGSRAADKVQRHVHVEYECEVKEVLDHEVFRSRGLRGSSFPGSVNTMEASTDCYKWPQYVELTNGKMYGCDLMVSATGVIPSTEPFTSSAQLSIADDGGIKVDSSFHTNIPDVYAAGDVCSASWELSPDWFQMRLWSQARQMGVSSARCMMAHMSNEHIDQDFCFELFAHVTHFFGYKVVLLGRFNGQGLGSDHELLVRCTKGMEYVKVVLHEGKMRGALLIGETDLEETFENLILNGMDLSSMKDLLLDPQIDIEDYFD